MAWYPGRIGSRGATVMHNTKSPFKGRQFTAEAIL